MVDFFGGVGVGVWSLTLLEMRIWTDTHTQSKAHTPTNTTDHTHIDPVRALVIWAWSCRLVSSTVARSSLILGTDSYASKCVASCVYDYVLGEGWMDAVVGDQ